MKKKLLSIVLTLAMGAALLAGCGGSGSSQSAAPAAEPAAEAPAEGGEAAAPAEEAGDSSVTKTSYGEYTAENPYDLTFAYIEFYQQDAAQRTKVQDAINEYMIPNYHIRVTLLPLEAASYTQTEQLMISGGDKLDVLPVFYSNASNLISMNGIVDMMPYMDTPEGQKIIDALGEANAYVGQMGGILFAFPANKESVELGGLAMRADICDELGITEKYGLDRDDEYHGKVWDWSVATDIFATVKEAYPDMIPLYLSGSSSPMRRFAFFDELADQFGVLDWESDHDSTKVVNEFETEAYKEAVTRLAEWYDAGYIYKDAATDTQGDATMIKGGNTFSYATAIKPGFLAEHEAARNTKLYAMYFEDQVEGGISTTNVSFFDTGIASNSDDPDMAFKFISAFYSDPVLYNLWLYGIEGEDYVVLEDGTAYYPEGVDDSNYKYHQNIGWELGNQFQSYVWNDGSKDADYWNKLQHHNDWAYYSPAHGFMWDSSQYQTQLTALKNALDTYRPALETGSVGVANVEKTLQQLNDALYAAGLQEVMDAKQAQLDEWLAANGPTATPQANLDTIAGGVGVQTGE